MPTQVKLTQMDYEGLVDTPQKPDDSCINYGSCGNVVPGNGQMCGPCLTAARRRDRENEPS